jgi:hypothetical protein
MTVRFAPGGFLFAQCRNSCLFVVAEAEGSVGLLDWER